MSPRVMRSGMQAVGLGVAGGAAFAATLSLWSAATGASPWLPFDMFASLLQGRGALDDGGALGTLLAGAVVNVVFSGSFGFVYGAFNGLLPGAAHARLGRQLVTGALFGAALYVVDFQLVGMVLMPWLLELPQLPLLLAHAAVFGPLVAVMFTMAERREQAAHPLGAAV